MQNAMSFLDLIFVGFVALFPPVNPIGTAIVVDPLLSGLDTKARHSASFKIAMYCFMICAGTILIGSWLLKLFGISLPVVQLAGGIMICRMGWQQLTSDEGAKDSESNLEEAKKGQQRKVADILFYPLAFPMTTGAGTISVLLTLSAHGHSNGWEHYLLNLNALIVAVALMAVLIYLSYAFTPFLLRRLGTSGEQIVNRLSSFLVFCIGIQIAVGGVTHLVQTATAPATAATVSRFQAPMSSQPQSMKVMPLHLDESLSV